MSLVIITDVAVFDLFITFWGQEGFIKQVKIDEISTDLIAWGMQKDSG